MAKRMSVGPIGPDCPVQPAEGEPFFVLRAQDALSVSTLEAYATNARAVAAGLKALPQADELQRAGADHLEAQAREVDAIAAHFSAWQGQHVDRVKLPD